jgi:phage-related tail protein
MDDKLRLERNSLKSALDASHATELSRAVDAAKKEAERDSKTAEKRLREDNDRLQQQIQSLQRDINALNQKLTDAVNEAVKEGDKKVLLGLCWTKIQNSKLVILCISGI